MIRYSRLYACQPAKKRDRDSATHRRSPSRAASAMLLLRDAGNLIERERVNHTLQVLQGKVEPGPAPRESAQRVAHRAGAP